MDKQRTLEELLDLLEAEGVEVRTEALGGGGGGLCVIKDKRIFFVDTQTSLAEMAAICGEAVAKLVDVEKVYIRPEVREFIEQFSDKNEN